MLWLASAFLILSIIFGVLGFGAAAGMAWVGFKVLFFVFLVAFVVSLLMGVFRRSV